MSPRAKKRIIKWIKEGVAATFFLIILIGLISASLSQAKTEVELGSLTTNTAAPATAIMGGLISTEKNNIKCKIPEVIPPEKRCTVFFYINELTLRNLVQNYTECLDGNSYYLNFSNQPAVILNDTLKIYGRTDEPFVISGLKIKPSGDFDQTKPAIAIYGKEIILKDISIKDFDHPLFYAANENIEQKIIGGKIVSGKSADVAITSCFEAPQIDRLEIKGFDSEIAIIGQ